MSVERETGTAPADTRMEFEALVRAYQRPLHAHVRLVYPSVATDAVVNATFAAAWQHFGDIPPGAMSTWLRATARHIVLNTTRSERRWRALTDKVALLDPGRPHDEAADSDARLSIQLVATAMAALSGPERELLLMCALEDLTTDDLAAILQIRPDAAKARLSRARARLRAEVGRMEHDDEGSAP